MLVSCIMRETSVAKALSELTSPEMSWRRDWYSLRGSGFPCRSLTTVMICCRQVRRVERASLKFLADRRGASIRLRPSTLAFGSEGRYVWSVMKRRSRTVSVPFCIAVVVTLSGRTELSSSARIVASKMGICRGRVWPVVGSPTKEALCAGVNESQVACCCLAACTAWFQKVEACRDQVLSAIAVFCSHSLMTRVTVVGSPPLMFNLGRLDRVLLIVVSWAGARVSGEGVIGVVV